MNIDDNALYRQKELREMRDTTQEDERENRAQQWELNYISPMETLVVWLMAQVSRWLPWI